MASALPNSIIPPGGSVVVVAGMSLCPHCGTSMLSTVVACPACGWPMRTIAAQDRALASLAYFTMLPAIVLLLLPAFRARRFVRFHAAQSVLIWGAFLVLTVVALFLSNVTAAMFFLLLGIITSLAMFFLWIVLSIKAWQGERFGLPFIGMLAGRLR